MTTEIKTGTYTNGQKWENHYENGHFVSCGVWYDNGQKKGEYRYENEELVSSDEWNEQGELICSWRKPNADIRSNNAAAGSPAGTVAVQELVARDLLWARKINEAVRRGDCWCDAEAQTIIAAKLAEYRKAINDQVEFQEGSEAE